MPLMVLAEYQYWLKSPFSGFLAIKPPAFNSELGIIIAEILRSTVENYFDMFCRCSNLF